MQDSASFWTDIKNLEEQLEKSPDSYCFARLSDVYRKVGMIDDALHFARQGVARHPGYLSGQRALALACHAKGLNSEALAALQLITAAVPEDIPSQKLLGQISVETGDFDTAGRAFRTALDFAPDDTECRIELESLERSAGIGVFTGEMEDDDEEIIEDLEIYEECDDLSEDLPNSNSELQSYELSQEPVSVTTQDHDPLSTSTLAELYVLQGFTQKALEIYRTILSENPLDQTTLERVAELEALEAGSIGPETDIEDTTTVGYDDESSFSMPSPLSFQEVGPVVVPDAGSAPDGVFQQNFEIVPESMSSTCLVLPHGTADNALATLDGWLENIRRIKACR